MRGEPADGDRLHVGETVHLRRHVFFSRRAIAYLTSAVFTPGHHRSVPQQRRVIGPTGSHRHDSAEALQVNGHGTRVAEVFAACSSRAIAQLTEDVRAPCRDRAVAEQRDCVHSAGGDRRDARQPYHLHRRQALSAQAIPKLAKAVTAPSVHGAVFQQRQAEVISDREPLHTGKRWPQDRPGDVIVEKPASQLAAEVLPPSHDRRGFGRSRRGRGSARGEPLSRFGRAHRAARIACDFELVSDVGGGIAPLPPRVVTRGHGAREWGGRGYRASHADGDQECHQSCEHV